MSDEELKPTEADETPVAEAAETEAEQAEEEAEGEE